MIVDVARDGLRLCSSTSLEPILCKFDSSFVSDLEITNAQELFSRVKVFVEQKKIKPGNLVLILASSVYFEKDYPGPLPPTQETAEEFIDTVPFSATSSKIFKKGNSFKQVVINRDHYEALRHSFEDLGFKIAAVVPDFVLGSGSQGEFSAESCRLIYRKLDQIIADSIITQNDETSLHQKEQAFLEKHKILLALFSLLFIGGAVVMVAITLNSPPFKKSAPVKKVVTVTPVPKISPSPIPTPTPATPSAELISSYSVQVLNASGVSGQAASLSNLLKGAGFTKITTGNASTQTGKVIIVAKPSAATSAGEFVTKIVSSLYPEYSFRQESAATSDFVITITKPTP